MLRKWLWAAGFLAAAGVLLGTPSRGAAQVSVRVGGLGVGVGVGRPFYYGGYYPVYPRISSYRVYTPYYPPYSSSWYYNPWWAGVYTPYPSYLPPGPAYAYGSVTVPGTYQSYYPSTTSTYVTPTYTTPAYGGTAPAAPANDPNSVLVNVRVPDPNAQVMIDGVATTQQGTSRQFVSPPLTPGRKYSYDIEARWTENGKQVSETRKVFVQAGETVSVDFTQPSQPGEQTIKQ